MSDPPVSDPPVTGPPVTGPVAPDRAALLVDTSLTGRRFVERYTAETDAWLRRLFDTAAEGRRAEGVALVAVGGYGRAELAPFSDLDLLLIHDGRSDDVTAVAERFWYPIWDTGVKLGHAVRSLREALALADDDLDTATAMLDVRCLAGDAAVSAALAERAEAQWHKRAKRRLGALAQSVRGRHEAAGEVAFLLEPDLKAGRGGLRDVHALHWAERAGLVLHDGDGPRLSDAYETLLAVRVELHRVTRRSSDVLLLEDQDAVAAALPHTADADELMAQVSAAARSIAWISDEAWAATVAERGSRRRGLLARDRTLADGVVIRQGVVALNPKAPVATDPTAVLRLAAGAAEQGARIERATLLRLAAELAPFPDPWPEPARDLLARLLLAGGAAIGVVEALDQYGVWCRILPEWEPVRSRPQRNAYHRFTVDRHLCEAAANAAELADQVQRPDLLVIGTLLHDIGKGYPGDHTVGGIDLVERIGARMGFEPDDVNVLVDMVRHHLLLPEVATRRDLDDDATIVGVAEAVRSSSPLHLLAALTEADSLATGPSAWGSWKADLVRDLVRRTDHVLAGGVAAEVTAAAFPSPAQQALLDARRLVVSGEGDRLTVVSPDRPGLFARVTGVLALHGLDVLWAGAHSADADADSGDAGDGAGMALEAFRVASVFGGPVAWDKVTADINRALSGRLAVEARLAERERTYDRRRRRSSPGPIEPTVTVDNQASVSSTVVEVHAPDRVGLLYRLTRALADLDVDIRRAIVQTLGENVVDVFYVRNPDDGKINDPDHLAELERAVLHAIGRP